MKILTFDIAIKTGWCFGEIGGKLVGGTKRHAVSGAGHDVVFGKAMIWIADLINVYRPDRVGYEFNQGTIAGKQQRGQTTIDVIKVHCGLRALILGVCHSMSVEAHEVSASEAASSFLGPNKFKVKGDSKEPVKHECRVRGLPFDDDNHADALALWHQQAFLVDPDFAARDAVARMMIRNPSLGGRA